MEEHGLFIQARLHVRSAVHHGDDRADGTRLQDPIRIRRLHLFIVLPAPHKLRSSIRGIRDGIDYSMPELLVETDSEVFGEYK
jgi:hypothetical protein